MDARLCWVNGVYVPVECQPGGRSLGYATVVDPGVDIFNQVDILHAHAVAGSHDRTGVSALVYVLQNHAQPSRTLLQGIVKLGEALFADVGQQRLRQGFACFEIRGAPAAGPEHGARGLIR